MQQRHPADRVWLILLAFGLGADIPLLRAGHQSVSQRAGCTTVRRAAVVYMALHLAGVLPARWDPLCRLGSCLRRKPA